MRAAALLAVLALPSLLATLLVSGCGSEPSQRPQASETWYFTVDSARPGHSERIHLFNPGDTAQTVELAFFAAGAQGAAGQYRVRPRRRLTVDLSGIAPSQADTWVRLTSEEPVVAEKTVSVRNRGPWRIGYAAPGAVFPLSKWHFASGSVRKGYETYLSIVNPGDAPAEADLTFYCDDGSVERRDGIAVGANQRTVVAVHEEGHGLGRSGTARDDFAVVVESPGGSPLVVERTTYFEYTPYTEGAHSVTGAAEPLSEWHFAGGSAREGYDTYLHVFNPGEKDATIDIRYCLAGGDAVERKEVGIPGRGRITVAAFDEKYGVGRSAGADGDLSITVKSTNGVPVVAENSVYYGYRPLWNGGAAAMGEPAAGETWYFAAGCTRHGFDTHLGLFNPGEKEAVVDVTYYRGDNSVKRRKGMRVAGRSRASVSLQDTGTGIGRCDDDGGDTAVKLECSNGVPIVAERTMYVAPRWRTMDKDVIAARWNWGEVTAGNRERGTVALTVDDIPTAGAGRMLDVLRDRDASATFFMLEPLIESNPEMVKRFIYEGHEVGNHSVNHPQFTRIPQQQAVNEIEYTDADVRRLTGLSTKPYFRFPYGDRNDALIGLVNSLGYLSVYWTVDPQDWRGTNSARQVVDTILTQSTSGSIILLHGLDRTADVLGEIVDGLRAKGLEPVTLTELLEPGP
ncbi:MAG: polysaccharide deacetylase family protein [Gemmatimonadetes bacterium]|nr:polysaccharide deacetylase family protein [Gemmatimonadota bacterium]